MLLETHSDHVDNDQAGIFHHKHYPSEVVWFWLGGTLKRCPFRALGRAKIGETVQYEKMLKHVSVPSL